MAANANANGHDAMATALVRLNAHVLGAVLGLLAGGGLFLATVVLLIQGGDNVGQTLALLGHFFPGYGISFGGAVIGGLWGLAAGYAVGFVVGRAYGPWFLRGAARMLERRGRPDALGIHTIVGLRPLPFATVTAGLSALGLVAATNWLWMRYDGHASPHLELLANFLPGFASNPLGSLVGAASLFVYVFVGAFGAAWIYGRVSTARNA